MKNLAFGIYTAATISISPIVSAGTITTGKCLIVPSNNVEWLRAQSTDRTSNDQILSRTVIGGDLFGYS